VLKEFGKLLNNLPSFGQEDSWHVLVFCCMSYHWWILHFWEQDIAAMCAQHIVAISCFKRWRTQHMAKPRARVWCRLSSKIFNGTQWLHILAQFIKSRQAIYFQSWLYHTEHMRQT